MLWPRHPSRCLPSLPSRPSPETALPAAAAPPMRLLTWAHLRFRGCLLALISLDGSRWRLEAPRQERQEGPRYFYVLRFAARLTLQEDAAPGGGDRQGEKNSEDERKSRTVRAPVVSRSVTQLTPARSRSPTPSLRQAPSHQEPSFEAQKQAACPKRRVGARVREHTPATRPHNPTHVYTHIHPRVHCLPLLHACLTSPATDPGPGVLEAPGVSQRSREAMGSPQLCAPFSLSPVSVSLGTVAAGAALAAFATTASPLMLHGRRPPWLL
ncbi:hypothetical protein E2C01_048549 [Portunus trituberculatus]|uniref:Uncharacterized protein n=1 Tax=Portunus trituberculatus TaxID=210409 RepID=A0A5B7GDQ7_PORTR|nr:hypothetical protein [Portunus trituberculatus]